MTLAVDSTVHMLRDDILSGRIAAGSRLGEADLAEQFAISRTPVREALARLSAEGLVELVPNRGARVATWTVEQLREIFDLRVAVEPAVVAQAVGKFSDAELDELDDLARQMLRLGRPGRHQQLNAIVELNRCFHDTFIRVAANSTFAASLRTVTHPAVVRRNYAGYDADSLARSLHHHIEMVAAARIGDADWAAAIMHAHLHNARAAMLPSGRSSQ